MASKGSTLGTNEYLNVDDYLQSANGRYKAALQADGNFVLSRGSATLWQSGTGQGPGAYFALMQDDGNFAVYLGTPQQPGNWVWGSESVRGPGNYVLALQDDGNLVLSQRVPIWNSAQPDQQAQPQPDQQAEPQQDRAARAAGTTEEVISIASAILGSGLFHRRKHKDAEEEQPAEPQETQPQEAQPQDQPVQAEDQFVQPQEVQPVTDQQTQPAPLQPADAQPAADQPDQPPTTPVGSSS